MGKVEKVVVLLVLFLVAVILGVSLNASDGVAGPRDTVAQADPAEGRPQAAPMSPIERTPVAPEREANREAGRELARDLGSREASTGSGARSIAPRSSSSSAGTSGAEAPSRSRPIPRRRQESAPAQDQQVARQTGGGRPQEPAAGSAPAGPRGVLSTSRPTVQPEAEPKRDPRVSGWSQPASEPAPARAIEAAAPAADTTGGSHEGGNAFILTLADLAPSLSEEFMIYTWREGDSFPKVAERYFGSRLHVNRLLKNNEGYDDGDLRPGDRILVPVKAPVVAAAGNETEDVGAVASLGATTYTVRSGDVLGTISTTVYGTSRSWRKIYDANRDILADPNQLEVGMVLRIPE